MAKLKNPPNPALDLGFITLYTIEDPALEVKVRLAKDTPKMTGGYGGWEIVNRPRRRGTLEWKGVDPYEVTIDLLFDCYSYPRLPVTPEQWTGELDLRKIAGRLTNDVSNLDQMARPIAKGRPSPTLKVKGKMAPVDPDMTWVISEIKWGDAIFNSEGFFLRAECTVVLLQADGGEHANVLGPIKTGQPGGAGGKVPKFHTWKKGNTFALVSLRYYKTRGYAQKIMSLNHLRDYKKVKAGTKIKLPRP